MSGSMGSSGKSSDGMDHSPVLGLRCQSLPSVRPGIGINGLSDVIPNRFA